MSELGLPDRPWTVEGNSSVVLDAISIFGIDGCMFGSNFPVAGLFAPYATVVRGMFEILKKRPHAELDAFFCSNARRFIESTDDFPSLWFPPCDAVRLFAPQERRSRPGPLS